jgi:hypothetical protein
MPRKKQIVHEVVPDSDDDQDLDPEYILERHVENTQEGGGRYEYSKLPAPASPNKPKKNHAALNPDTRLELETSHFDGWEGEADLSSANVIEDEPVYDLVKESRALRRSVSAGHSRPWLPLTL